MRMQIPTGHPAEKTETLFQELQSCLLVQLLDTKKIQHTTALSSTEGEFVSLWEVGKMVLYFRSILDEIGIPQHHATTICEDNKGALYMANNQQPSTCTRHIDIKHFALIDWVEQDLLLIEKIMSSDNSSDGLPKPLAKTLHYRHYDTLMGRRLPQHL
jgi:hypothetical protein